MNAGLQVTPRGLSFDRVVFFSDAVFAIAITLLVIDLRPPNMPSDGYEAALQAFFGHPSPFIATAIGFLVVGSYWMSHRGIFALLDRTDGLVIWANLFFLFWVAIQPFFTAALAEHDPNRTSVIAYAACQVFAGLAQLGLWASAVWRGLLVPTASARKVRYVTIQLARAPLVFAISIGVVLLAGPEAGEASWGGILVLALIIQRVFRLARMEDRAGTRRGSAAGGDHPVAEAQRSSGQGQRVALDRHAEPVERADHLQHVGVLRPHRLRAGDQVVRVEGDGDVAARDGVAPCQVAAAGRGGERAAGLQLERGRGVTDHR